MFQSVGQTRRLRPHPHHHSVSHEANNWAIELYPFWAQVPLQKSKQKWHQLPPKFHNWADMMEWLASKGVDLEKADDDDGRTPIYDAARVCHSQWFLPLWTPPVACLTVFSKPIACHGPILMYFSQEGHLDVVKYFAPKGVDEKGDKYGQPLIHIAAMVCCRL